MQSKDRKSFSQREEEFTNRWLPKPAQAVIGIIILIIAALLALRYWKSNTAEPREAPPQVPQNIEQRASE